MITILVTVFAIVAGIFISLTRKELPSESAEIAKAKAKHQDSGDWSLHEQQAITTEQSTFTQMAPAEIRQRLIALEDLLRDWAKLKAPAKGVPQGERDRMAEKELQAKIKALRRALFGQFKNSQGAREELYRIVSSTSDDRAKRELMKFFGELPPDSQVNYLGRMTTSSDPKNQKTALLMLSSVNSKAAVTTMSNLADNRNADTAVRTDAIRNLGKSVFISQNPEMKAMARESIQNFASPNYEPQIRRSAYQAITMNPNLTTEDKTFLDQAVKTETDREALRAAKFSQKVAEAYLEQSARGERGALPPRGAQPIVQQ